MEQLIAQHLKTYFSDIYGKEINGIETQPTKPQFKGDLTVVVFPLLKAAPKKPTELGEELGEYLIKNIDELTSYNVVQGFLNIEISDSYFLGFL